MTIKKIDPILTHELRDPCKGHPYKLSYPYYAGAKYTWIRKSDNRYLGNSNTIDFPIFTESDNGQYECRVEWDACLVRVHTYDLDSHRCKDYVTGTVYHDTTDNGKIDGMPISTAGRQLYIHVLKEQAGTYKPTNKKVAVDTYGQFSIDGLTLNQKYRLVLSTSENPVTGSTPIEGWKFIGEATGDKPSDVDGTADGMLDITAGVGDLSNLRFGIKQLSMLRTNKHITTKM